MGKKFCDLLIYKYLVDRGLRGDSKVLELIKDSDVSLMLMNFVAEVSKVAKEDVLKGVEKEHFNVDKFCGCFTKVDDLFKKDRVIDRELVIDLIISVLSLSYLSSYMFWKFMLGGNSYWNSKVNAGLNDSNRGGCR